MAKYFPVELTTMCMITNLKGEILVQDRQSSDWPGWTFPGGHVEADESMITAIIRELNEETSLMLQPTLMGTAEWLHGDDGRRELAGLFTAVTDQEPDPEAEQPLFWVTKDALLAGPLAGSLGQLLPIFFGESSSFFRDDRQEI